MLRPTVLLAVAALAGCAAPPPLDGPGDDAPSHESDDAVEPQTEGEQATVKKQFSRRLSPQARKAALLGGEGETVRALVQVAASADVDELRERLEQEGAAVGAWMEETRLLTIEIAPERLEALAELPGVVYVEMATAYRR